MSNQRYNGWANRSTWCVSLWWSNDEYNQGLSEEQAAECWARAGRSNTMDRSSEARALLAETLHDRLDAEAESLLGSSGLVADLFGAAAGEIDWIEIADSLLSEVDTEGEEPEDKYEPLGKGQDGDGRE